MNQKFLAVLFAQVFGSLTAVGIAYWVPLRERRVTEARIASDRKQLATQRAERVRSLAFDVERLAHNGLASAESRWRNNEAAIPTVDITDLHQRISLAEQIEHNKHRIAILSGLRSLLDELKILCEVSHVTDFVFMPDFGHRKTQWLSIVNALNDEALRAVSAAESGAAD
ncbi:hypothetical protein [Burkholderia stagnalis]|uniref:hypothetical protein n=1 Tax=Burkholderia stagnalis TaxID=1503054 RepID=UPI0012D8E853|nr:hypothetical protein [Burkholderia stagnalis]